MSSIDQAQPMPEAGSWDSLALVSADSAATENALRRLESTVAGRTLSIPGAE
jgi:hypothetical protein